MQHNPLICYSPPIQRLLFHLMPAKATKRKTRSNSGSSFEVLAAKEGSVGESDSAIVTVHRQPPPIAPLAKRARLVFDGVYLETAASTFKTAPTSRSYSSLPPSSIAIGANGKKARVLLQKLPGDEGYKWSNGMWSCQHERDSAVPDAAPYHSLCAGLAFLQLVHSPLSMR